MSQLASIKTRLLNTSLSVSAGLSRPGPLHAGGGGGIAGQPFGEASRVSVCCLPPARQYFSGDVSVHGKYWRMATWWVKTQRLTKLVGDFYSPKDRIRNNLAGSLTSSLVLRKQQECDVINPKKCGFCSLFFFVHDDHISVTLNVE